MQQLSDVSSVDPGELSVSGRGSYIREFKIYEGDGRRKRHLKI